MLGQIMDGMVQKSRMYNLSLPPDLERVRDELKRTQVLPKIREVALVR
jgi:hypothetical protein